MSHPQYDLDHGHLMNLLNRLFDLGAHRLASHGRWLVTPLPDFSVGILSFH